MEKSTRNVAEVEHTPVLLYDGECGVCARSVQFVLQHEPQSAGARLRFAPMHGEFAATVFARHPALRAIDSVVWYERPASGAADTVYVRSAAVLEALRYLGGGWRRLATVGGLVPRALRDAAYNAIARRRLLLAPRACLLPTAPHRERFLR